MTVWPEKTTHRKHRSAFSTTIGQDSRDASKCPCTSLFRPIQIALLSQWAATLRLETAMHEPGSSDSMGPKIGIDFRKARCSDQRRWTVIWASNRAYRALDILTPVIQPLAYHPGLLHPPDHARTQKSRVIAHPASQVLMLKREAYAASAAAVSAATRALSAAPLASTSRSTNSTTAIAALSP